jgi:hypothetical protein
LTVLDMSRFGPLQRVALRASRHDGRACDSV